jgi:hydrogenase maturation protease
LSGNEQTNDGAGEGIPGIIKIIGMGQSLRGDDAVGLEAVRFWQEAYPGQNKRADLQVELAELPGIGLLNLIEGARIAILVDAVRSGAEPGTIHLLLKEQLEAFENNSGSAHGWGVAETLRLGEKLLPVTIPQKIILIGIEAADFTLGSPLSPLVKQALPEVARLIEQILSGE